MPSHRPPKPKVAQKQEKSNRPRTGKTLLTIEVAQRMARRAPRPVPLPRSPRPRIPHNSRKPRGRHSDNQDMPHPPIDMLSLSKDT